MVWKSAARIRAGVVGVLLLGLALTACTPAPPPHTPSPGLPGPDGALTSTGFTVAMGDVTATGPAATAPEGTAVHLVATTTQAPQGMRGMTSASKPLELTFDGGVEPSVPVTITWRIPDGNTADTATLAFLSVDAKGTWSGTPVTVADGVATATLTHSGFFIFAWAGDTMTWILNRVQELLTLDYAAPACQGKTVTTAGRIYSVSAKPDGVYACVENVKGQAGISIYSHSPFVWRFTPNAADASGQAPASTADTDLAGFVATAAYDALQGNKFTKETALVPNGKATVVLNAGVASTRAQARVDAGLALIALLVGGVDVAAGAASGQEGPIFAKGTVNLDAVKGQGECLAGAATAIDTAASGLDQQFNVALGCIAGFGGLITGTAPNAYPVVVAIAESLVGPLATQIAKMWGETTNVQPIAITVTSDAALTPEILAQLCSSKFGTDTAVTGSTTITHKAWGESTVVTCGPASTSRPSQNAGVLVVDGTGTVRWSKAFGQSVDYVFELAKPATDKTGNIFIKYNPGRYDGVAIVRPTSTSMKVLAGGYDDKAPLSFYYAELQGPGSNGRYTIVAYNNNCIPDCATGTVTSQTYTWNGTTYVKKK